MKKEAWKMCDEIDPGKIVAGKITFSSQMKRTDEEQLQIAKGLFSEHHINMEWFKKIIRK